MAADVDEAFLDWFHTHQPLRQVLAEANSEKLRVNVVQSIQNELKQAFVHGFARGVASEVARFPADHPELGPIR